MAETVPISEARTETAHASRYLQQLAKHWSHKFEVQFTPTAATIDLPLGRCELAADDQALEVTLKGTPHVDMARFDRRRRAPAALRPPRNPDLRLARRRLRRGLNRG